MMARWGNVLPHKTSGWPPAQRWCSREQRLCHLWLTRCTRNAQWATEACSRGGMPSVQALRDGVTERILGAGGRVDYVEVDVLCLRSLHLCCCVESSLALFKRVFCYLLPSLTWWIACFQTVAGMQGASGARFMISHALYMCMCLQHLDWCLVSAGRTNQNCPTC
jgi:hypothetical protein